MNFINKQVTHRLFGKGKVVGLSDSWIEVHFANGTKRFEFPDAFGTFLKLADKEAAEVAMKMKHEKESEEKELEAARRKVMVQQEEERLRQIQRNKRIKNLKIHPSSQAVFWCNKEEQSRVFEEWQVFTGTIQSGKSKGQVRKLSRLAGNSACIITTRESNMAEEDRFITGIFMAKEDFDGGLCEDGYIAAHSEFRLQLTDKESRKILFWNYYINERYPNRITWNAGRYRYIDNIWVAQILKDIVSIRENSDDKEDAQTLLQYFCRMNHINENEVPESNGALKRL